MGQGRIPEEVPMYYAPETYTGFFDTVTRRVKIYNSNKNNNNNDNNNNKPKG